jgi:hypothetical protein
MLASSLEEMLPARSDLVAPDMASLAWFLSEIGKLLPGPANRAFAIMARFAGVNVVTIQFLYPQGIA